VLTPVHDTVGVVVGWGVGVAVLVLTGVEVDVGVGVGVAEETGVWVGVTVVAEPPSTPANARTTLPYRSSPNRKAPAMYNVPSGPNSIPLACRSAS
jgi:hypothetical protein